MQTEKDRDEEWPPGTVKIEGQSVYSFELM